MRGKLPALALSALLLAACGGDSGASTTNGSDYVHAFKTIYNDRQSAYDRANQALGSTKLSAATPDQLRTWFSAMSDADYAFTESIGKMTASGNMDTICQSGSFDWK